MKIVSFNTNKLNFNGKDKEYCSERFAKVVELLQKAEADIIMLQEIMSEETVEKLADQLNYDYCTSKTLYNDLNKSAEFTNKHLSSFKSEYAFLWNPNTVNKKNDPQLYMGIYDFIDRALEDFIVYLTGIVLGIGGTVLGIGIGKKIQSAIAPAENEDEKNESKKTKTKVTKKSFLEKIRTSASGAFAGMLGVFGGVKIGKDIHQKYGEDINKSIKELDLVKEKVQEVLRATLRPPMICIFYKKNNGNKELRLINTHTQFAKETTGALGMPIAEIRKQEVNFVLGRIFSIVNSSRGSDNNTAITIVAGDYNLPLKKLSGIPTEKDAEGEIIKTKQDQNTTVYVGNSDDAVSAGSCKLETSNNYDHFSFIENIVLNEEKEATPALMEFKEENFVVKKSDKWVTISDHKPIIMEFDF